MTEDPKILREGRGDQQGRSPCCMAPQVAFSLQRAVQGETFSDDYMTQVLQCSLCNSTWTEITYPNLTFERPQALCRPIQ